MDGGGDNVAKGEWRRDDPCGDEAGNVSHVSHLEVKVQTGT